MKKIILSTIAASAVLSLGVSQAHADTYTKDTYMPSKETKKPVKITLPNALNQTVINQMKQGTYNIKGIAIGSLYSDVNNKIGSAEDESVMRFEELSDVTAFYGDFYIGASGLNRYTNVNDMIVDSLTFDYTKKHIKLSQLKPLLGKYDDSEIYNDINNDKTDDYLVRRYGMLTASFERINNEWELQDITVSKQEEEEQPKSDAFKDSRIKPVSKNDIQLMMKGTYSVKGVKPGMKHEEVLTILGESSDDYIMRNKSRVTLNSNYGSEGMIGFNYSMNKADEFILKNIQVMSSSDEQKLSSFEKVIGKPAKTKYDHYELEENGKTTKIKTAEKYYGKHVMISAEKNGKEWYVTSVTYK